MTYSNEKYTNGKCPYKILRWKDNLEALRKNSNTIKYEDFKIFKQILKEKRVDNNESVQAMITMYCSRKTGNEINFKEKVQRLGEALLIPPLIEIVKAFALYRTGIQLDESIINLGYNMVYLFFVYCILLFCYLGYEIYKMSTPEYYVIPQIKKMLFEIQLENTQSKLVKRKIKGFKRESKQFGFNEVLRNKIEELKR